MPDIKQDWTLEELRAEAGREITIHELQSQSDRTHGHFSGAVFHDRKAAFWRAILQALPGVVS